MVAAVAEPAGAGAAGAAACAAAGAAAPVPAVASAASAGATSWDCTVTSAAAGATVTPGTGVSVRSGPIASAGTCSGMEDRSSLLVCTSRDVSGPAAVAATPVLSTRPEAAAITAAWRPTLPALLTASARADRELLRCTGARWRARSVDVVIWGFSPLFLATRRQLTRTKLAPGRSDRECRPVFIPLRPPLMTWPLPT